MLWRLSLGRRTRFAAPSRRLQALAMTRSRSPRLRPGPPVLPEGVRDVQPAQGEVALMRFSSPPCIEHQDVFWSQLSDAGAVALNEHWLSWGVEQAARGLLQRTHACDLGQAAAGNSKSRQPLRGLVVGEGKWQAFVALYLGLPFRRRPKPFLKGELNRKVRVAGGNAGGAPLAAAAVVLDPSRGGACPEPHAAVVQSRGDRERVGVVQLAHAAPGANVAADPASGAPGSSRAASVCLGGGSVDTDVAGKFRCRASEVGTAPLPRNVRRIFKVLVCLNPALFRGHGRVFLIVPHLLACGRHSSDALAQVRLTPRGTLMSTSRRVAGGAPLAAAAAAQSRGEACLEPPAAHAAGADVAADPASGAGSSRATSVCLGGGSVGTDVAGKLRCRASEVGTAPLPRSARRIFKVLVCLNPALFRGHGRAPHSPA
jgi:hypothetical protein